MKNFCFFMVFRLRVNLGLKWFGLGGLIGFFGMGCRLLIKGQDKYRRELGIVLVYEVLWIHEGRILLLKDFKRRLIKFQGQGILFLYVLSLCLLILRYLGGDNEYRVILTLVLVAKLDLSNLLNELFKNVLDFELLFKLYFLLLHH